MSERYIHRNTVKFLIKVKKIFGYLAKINTIFSSLFKIIIPCNYKENIFFHQVPHRT